uniref:Uperin-2.5 n=1 Tax=Uperoleia inundata TaxID=104953 RepID=UPE25_UPEIN|nr:RecName: Full=Uperin-2.5 [Uperoleia inundata]
GIVDFAKGVLGKIKNVLGI